MFTTGSITRKLMTVILATCGVVLTLTCGTFYTYQLVTSRQSTSRSLSILARVIAANSTASLAFDNSADATEVLSAVAAEPDVVAAALYDRSGRLFAKYPDTAQVAVSSESQPGGLTFGSSNVVLYEPVAIGERRLGTLYLESNLGEMRGRLAFYGVIVTAIFLVTSIVAVALSFRLQRHVSRPILQLWQTAMAVSAHGDYSVRATRVSVNDDELGRLTDAFNAMLARVEDQNNTLREQGDALRTEVTERAKAEAEVRLLNADLERRVAERTNALQTANKELESFSYSVSHDLRAPLRHVLGYLEMLEEETAGKLSDDARRYLETVRTSTLEMNQLIEDLLGFARMGRAEMQEQAIELDEIVHDTIRRLADGTEGRDIEWRVQALPTVIGDRALLQMALTNLLGNAVKYSRGREHAQITIGCEGEEMGRAVIFVRDNGAGFDMRYVHKLFGVFQRLHRADQFEGTGIGLATVRRIVARHGGRVWAEGALGEGATFFFTMKRANLTDVNHMEHAIAS